MGPRPRKPTASHDETSGPKPTELPGRWSAQRKMRLVLHPLAVIVGDFTTI